MMSGSSIRGRKAATVVRQAVNTGAVTSMVPIIAASLGFMLPVATPPNAIVYGSGAVTARDMLRTGAVLDIICIAVVSHNSKYAARKSLSDCLMRVCH